MRLKQIKNKLISSPFISAILIVVAFWWIKNQFGMPDPILAVSILAAFGFTNSLWLNARINRIQDVLNKKSLADDWEFIVDEGKRNLVSEAPELQYGKFERSFQSGSEQDQEDEDEEEDQL